MSINIAIDGPAGAGKSTIAKKVAKQLKYIYVDTGAMYRAMALFFIRNKIAADNVEEINRKCKEADITIQYIKDEQVVLLNGENVNGFIRNEEVGNMASATSIYPDVRKKLVELQQKLALSNNVVMDGRDIGTCVLPNANVKVYLTASSKVRAERRYKELMDKGVSADIDKIEADIIERDERDMTRSIAPLKKADDATLVDSSQMTIEQVVNCIMDIINNKSEGND